MSNRNLQNHLTEGPYQLLRLDETGQVLFSSSSLFEADGQVDILDLFPLVESIWPILSQSTAPVNTIEFRAVQVTHPSLLGFYDFYFDVVWMDDSKEIHWKIFDRTTYYQEYQAAQQRINENELKN